MTRCPKASAAVVPEKKKKKRQLFLTGVSQCHCLLHHFASFLHRLCPLLYRSFVPTGSPSRGGNVTVYVCDINQPSLPTPFHSVLVSVSVFMPLSTVFHSKILPATLRSLTLFFWSFFLLYWSFQPYVSL